MINMVKFLGFHGCGPYGVHRERGGKELANQVKVKTTKIIKEKKSVKRKIIF